MPIVYIRDTLQRFRLTGPKWGRQVRFLFWLFFLQLAGLSVVPIIGRFARLFH